jgi:hypothetical protein
VTAHALAVESPCNGCEQRPTCREECARLAPLVSRVLKDSWHLTLFEQRHAAKANDDEDDAPCDPADEDARRASLVAALQRLPSDERQGVEARAAGVTYHELARRMKRGRDTLARLHAQGLARLRHLVITPTAVSPSTTLFAPKENPMPRKSPRPLDVVPAHALTPKVAACIHNGCNRPVSREPTTRPELRPFCAAHRRRLAGLAPEQVAALPSVRRTKVTPDEAGVADLLSLLKERQAMVHPVSPALAAALLLRNQKNRSVTTREIQKLAGDMAAGAWPVTNQGLGLGDDGLLYDGQHRLMAILHAGVTVKMLVVGGLDPAARATIDRGRTRSVGNVLQMFDGEAHGPKVVPWIRALVSLHGRADSHLSTHAAREELARYRASVDWLLAHGPRARPFGMAPVVAGLIYAHHVLGAEVEPFIRGYASGAGLPEGSPALALRRLVGEGGGPRQRERTLTLKTLSCVLAHVRGETLLRIPSNEDGYDHLVRIESGHARVSSA